MKLCALLLLFLIPAPGSQAQQDLSGKVFVFPEKNSLNYVILKANITRPLENATVCVSHYSDLIGRYVIFSLSTPGKNNAFLISRDAPSNVYYIAINQQSVSFKGVVVGLDWTYTCVAWESQTGVVRLWVNNKLYPRKVAGRGSSIAPSASAVLGQDRDPFGRMILSFAGEISNVNMWDYAFTWDDISGNSFNSFRRYTRKVISWTALRYEINGNVLLQPTNY
ncbi:C-reactive protein-like isoform X2 [Hyperolius riggenbachi]|uniref:C-reactive protein-like isoform X2 n=1 Tax=Hyperolius riggenbachi TaxID=752182 RepID=UPI0035A2F78C